MSNFKSPLGSKRPHNISRLDPGQRPRAAGKLVRFDAEVLKHGDEEIRHWRIVLRVEGEVLAVFETAAGEDEGEILVTVGVGVAEAAPVEDLGAVK